jgi:RNA polymerase sigma factor (TIGR02999 family)
MQITAGGNAQAFDKLPVADTMTDVTLLLERLQQGDSVAADELAPLVYSELHRVAVAKMARERAGHTLQATALVHEAWLRLGVGVFANRAHFFGAAAEAMRRILVDRARRKMCEKGGGKVEHVDVDEVEIAAPVGNEEEVLAVNEALDQFAALYPEKAELVKLRYFVGLTFEEAAGLLGISPTAAKREWVFARGWLHRRIVAGV